MSSRKPRTPLAEAAFKRLAIGLALFASVSACEGAPGGSSGGSTERVVLTPADVNPMGRSESIAVVQDLEVLDDGSVWVLNSVQPFFIGFDADGNVLREHGNAGGGPDEFLLPSAFVGGRPDTAAWVLDVRRHALINVSSADERTEIQIPQDVVPPGSVAGGRSLLDARVRTSRLGREILIPRTSGSFRPGRLVEFRMAILAADLLAFDPETGSVRDVVALGDALGDPAAGFEPVAGGFPLWYRLWAACGDDEIRAYDRASNEIRGFAADGTALGAIALPPVQLNEVSPRQFASAVFDLRAAEVTGGVGPRPNPTDSARIMNEMMEQAEGSPAELAAYLPRYVDFQCSADGTLWIQPIDLEQGGIRGGYWLRITADGSRREVHLPHGFDAFRFGDDRIWGVQRDEFDVASVVWIDLGTLH